MNTKPESPPNDFAKIEANSVPTRLDETAAILEEQLQHEADKRKEERFLWIFVVTLLIDALALRDASAVLTIGMLTFETVFLIGAARWLGVDWVVVVLERILEKYLSKPHGDD